MALVPAGTTRIYAGKTAQNHHMRQEEINECWSSWPRPDARLSGSRAAIPSPSRGAAKALHLAKNGIPFEIVPGITAATIARHTPAFR
jgi:uroporphyrin-III C-methyltransferase/precorrin-2 dehydrogenase/sirohydrochlorin ferrochelatase/uroporphyrin-III C-methyltransferase